MSPYEQLQQLKKNISKFHDPGLLFVMNQKARELEEQINRINNLTVNYEQVSN